MNKMVSGITDEEAALYDRQIRLWGLEGQKRLRAARILVCGLSPIAHEMIKNLALAGIGSLTLLEDRSVDSKGAGSHLFVRGDEVGQSITACVVPRVKDMNPRVEVISIDSSLDKVDIDMISKFDVVCVCSSSTAEISRIDRLCYSAGTAFYASTSYGIFGWIFSDLGAKFEYIIDTPGAKEDELTSNDWIPFDEAISRWTNDVKMSQRKLKRRFSISFFLLKVFEAWEKRNGATSIEGTSFSSLCEFKNNYLESEMGLSPETISDDAFRHAVESYSLHLPPVSAILGGFLAEDIVRCVMKKGKPMHNFFFFDGDEAKGMLSLR